MSYITHAIRQAPYSEWLFRWQATAIAAFAGGSLTAALFHLGAAVGVAVTRSVLSRGAGIGGWAGHHA
jgi:succinate dehydrogenase hydrophobic anchor subunit